jgi:hypothetical protein
MRSSLTRREFLRSASLGAAALSLPAYAACSPQRLGSIGQMTGASASSDDEDRRRLAAWSASLRSEHLASVSVPLGRSAVRVGELAIGSPYVAYTLEGYLRAGSDPTRTEPLFLSLTKFDCVSLVESCLAVSRASDEAGPARWDTFAAEVERMRYRGGVRLAYSSRLHYFSEWMSDGARRGLIEELGQKLGGMRDERPLRFMTTHRASYPALANEEVFADIAKMEIGLDAKPRYFVPTERISAVADRIATGDVLGFATSIAGLDVTHSAFAYRRPDGVLGVLHAPLSGGAVEVSRLPLPEYVAAIRHSTGILVARSLPA